MDTITNINAEPGITPNGVGENARLKKTCADFESIFIYYMFKSMRKSVPQNDLFGNTHGSEIYKSMTDQAMSDHIARGRGMGLGELLYNQLKISPLRKK